MCEAPARLEANHEAGISYVALTARATEEMPRSGDKAVIRIQMGAARPVLERYFVLGAHDGNRLGRGVAWGLCGLGRA